jgi:hypothetical protein
MKTDHSAFIPIIIYIFFWEPITKSRVHLTIDSVLESRKYSIRSEIFMAIRVQTVILWVAAVCSVVCVCVEIICCLYFMAEVRRESC